jgi:hypothetical protein
MSDSSSNDSGRTDPTRAVEVDPTTSLPHGAVTAPVPPGGNGSTGSTASTSSAGTAGEPGTASGAGTPGTPGTVWSSSAQDTPQDDVPHQAPAGPAAATGTVVTTPVTRVRGPNAGAMVLGLLCVLVAGLSIAREAGGLRVDWGAFGPGAIVGAGVLVLVLGVLGLFRRER